MHPFAVLLIMLTAGASAVYGHPAAAGTLAAQFWEESLPGTPMPESIAELVQEGIDHSPLVERYSVPDNLASGLTPASDGQRNYAAVVGQIDYHRPPSSSREATTMALPAGLYFLETQVHVGSTMTTLFQPAMVSPILPRGVAQKIPFGIGKLADVLTTFNIAPSSTEAAVVGETLSQCQASPKLPGEHKACATSLEGTVQSSMDLLASTTREVWAASSALPRAGLPQQEYVVQAVTPLDGDRHVGCHTMPYPYAVYYCHYTGSPTSAYIVSLRSLQSGGPQLTMATICHRDTSKWDPEHPAFKMLHTQPGGAPVCHFMSYASLLFGTKDANKP